MKAALVTQFDRPPRCAEVADPTPAPGELVVDVLAAALSRRVRSQADGSHYTSDARLPLIPGVDGVGRDADGRLRYFVLPEGAMAERVAIDPRRSVVLPADSDPVAVAAAMNPAMSSWIALRRRTALSAGARVLVMGATGHSGGLAVEIARHLGAGRVTAVGRNAGRLAELEDRADSVIALGEPEVARRLADAGADLDVVLDYLWGEPTAAALRAIVPARADDDRPLTWIQIGSAAGLDSPIPSAALRATKLQIVGSGQGSVSPRDILAELPALAEQISAGLRVRSRAVPLAEVEQAWAGPDDSSARIVIVP